MTGHKHISDLITDPASIRSGYINIIEAAAVRPTSP